MSAKKPNDKKKNSQEALQIKLKKIKEKVTQLQHELKEKNNKLLRTSADFQNFQKRIEKELIAIEEETKKKYLSELINLQEILKKAYEDENPKEGLKLILNNLEKFFEKEQIIYIDCLGKTFDHDLHHAVTSVEKDDCEDGTIVEELKKGYLVGDRLLRPSQVIVVKKKECDNKEAD